MRVSSNNAWFMIFDIWSGCSVHCKPAVFVRVCEAAIYTCMQALKVCRPLILVQYKKQATVTRGSIWNRIYKDIH